jgi:hypothetical protein
VSALPPPYLDTTPVGDMIHHFNIKCMAASSRKDNADALNAARCAEALSLAVLTYHADIAEAAIRGSIGDAVEPSP